VSEQYKLTPGSNVVQHKLTKNKKRQNTIMTVVWNKAKCGQSCVNTTWWQVGPAVMSSVSQQVPHSYFITIPQGQTYRPKTLN